MPYALPFHDKILIFVIVNIITFPKKMSSYFFRQRGGEMVAGMVGGLQIRIKAGEIRPAKIL
jgi:hypothetical protein